MVLRSFKIFLIICLIPLSIYASLDSINLGEKKFDLYFGPNSPELVINHYKNRIIFDDEIIMSRYIENQVGGSLFELEDYFNNELYMGMLCPDEAYREKSSYIQFLFRLQSISYFFQSLREHEYNSKVHGLNNNCEIKWSEIIKKCSAQTKEMKSFLANSKIALSSLEEILVSLEEVQNNSLSMWAKRINSNDIRNLTDLRIYQYCQYHDCSDLADKDKMNLTLNNICRVEQKELLSLCSEEDRIYGASYIPEMQSLIARSNGIRGIDEDSLARGCIRRYVVQNKKKESKSEAMAAVFSVLYDYNLSITPTMPNGRLFSIGAMKEFTDKGLKEVFSPPKKKVVKKVVPKKEEKIVLSNPEFEKIILPEIKKKKKKKKKVKVVKKEKPKEFKSSFLVSSEFRRNFKLDQVEIDMDKFYFDYVFKLSEKNKLKPLVERFSTINALRSMKNKDALGTKKSPVPLKFVKYLIDNNMNQRLFNIIITVGNSFYIFNDIDKDVKELELISLQNDVTTNFKWQIKIKEN